MALSLLNVHEKFIFLSTYTHPYSYDELIFLEFLRLVKNLLFWALIDRDKFIFFELPRIMISLFFWAHICTYIISHEFIFLSFQERWKIYFPENIHAPIWLIFLRVTKNLFSYTRTYASMWRAYFSTTQTIKFPRFFRQQSKSQICDFTTVVAFPFHKLIIPRRNGSLVSIINVSYNEKQAGFWILKRCNRQIRRFHVMLALPVWTRSCNSPRLFLRVRRSLVLQPILSIVRHSIKTRGLRRHVPPELASLCHLL